MSPKNDDIPEEQEMFSGKKKTSSWGSYCNNFKTDSDISDNDPFQTSDDASDRRDDLRGKFNLIFCFCLKILK